MDNQTLRRDIIIKLIKESPTPISGAKISEVLNVSRQVIVQDIAILRASNIDIQSTNKGYVITDVITRVFKVKHNKKDITDELTTIVDLGGEILDCFIIHDVYGEINVPLNISSRKDINDFTDELKTKEDLPLMGITNDIHYHTIKANSEKILDLIQIELTNKGYII